MSEVEALAKLFAERNYQWKFKDEGLRVPTAAEIEKTILMAVNALKDEPENAQLEVGRLIVKKRGSFNDVFVHVVELPA